MESRWNPDSEPGSAATTYNLLFVCSGNTCRSPLARVITQKLLRQRGWHHVSVASAGTAAVNGAPASANSLAVAAENGLDLSGHESRELTPELVEWADLILTMTPSQYELVARLDAAGKVALATDFIDGPGNGEAVHDPYGGDIQMYRLTFTQLEEAAAALLVRLEPILAP